MLRKDWFQEYYATTWVGVKIRNWLINDLRVRPKKEEKRPYKEGYVTTSFQLTSENHFFQLGTLIFTNE